MKLKYRYNIQVFDDQYMALALSKEEEVRTTLLHLNKTGKTIMELMQDETTEEEIVKHFLANYEGDENKIRSGVHDFIMKLKEQGLVLE